jgi:predicted site-specific integrase-resolvase
MTDSGTIMIVLEEEVKREEKVVIYARVSSHDQKAQLDTQLERLKNYCAIKGYQIHREYKEIGSGLNDNRPIFNKMLDEDKITRIVVEHKDRLTRFGFSFIEKLLSKQNIEIDVINVTENDKTDLVEDFVSVITSFCARIYGQRRNKRRVLELVKELETKE